MYSVPRGEGGQPPEIQLADPQQDLLRAGRGQGLHPTEDEAPNRLHKVSCVTLLLINRTNTSDKLPALRLPLIFYPGNMSTNSQTYRVECDGKDMTPKLRELKVQAVIFLNIQTYSSGTRPWNRQVGEQRLDDGLLEVIGKLKHLTFKVKLKSLT